MKITQSAVPWTHSPVHSADASLGPFSNHERENSRLQRSVFSWHFIVQLELGALVLRSQREEPLKHLYLEDSGDPEHDISST
jgi:hypothetical protein